MKGVFTSLTKEIVISFWGSVLFVVVFWMITGRALVLSECIQYGCAALLVLLSFFLLLSVISLIRLRRKNILASRTLREQGVTPWLIGFLWESIDSAVSDGDRASAQLVMASVLSEGGFYDRCFEILAGINFHDLSQAGQEEYFNIYVYTNLMLGDAAAARQIYDRTSMYFDRARMRRHPMAVLHTLGVLSYAEGDISGAENYFMQARAASRDKASLCECEMFLSLCYMKLNKPANAAQAARAAASHAVSVYQMRYVEGLREKLEAAYSH
ncbi:MAG: hypothetical protein IKP95_06350 [Ruminococcus sp.]|nr:hypothetical protein [Ruminococcus sp.]